MATEANGSAGSHPKDHNQLADLTALKKALTQIEKKIDKLESMKGEYMAACKSVREEIAEQYRIAKDKGVMKRALKTLVAMRQLQRRMEDTVNDLDEDIAEEYTAYAEAVAGWEGTPLAEAIAQQAASEYVTT